MARQYLDLAQVYGAVDQSRANQANQEAQRMQMDNMRYQQQRQMNQDQLQERKRGIYAGAVTVGEDGKPVLDRKRLIADMLGVDGEEALARQTQFDTQDAAAAKAQREAQKEELAFQAETLKQAKDIAATIYDDSSFEQAKPLLMKIAPQMPLPDRFDTKWRDNITLTAEGRIKQIENELTRGVTMRGQDITMRGQDLSRDTTLRGQDLSASTARRGQDISARNADQRLAFDRSGGVTAVNAKNGINSNGEKLTEGMRNNAMYAQRMTAAEKLLGNTREQKPGVMETIAGSAPLVGTEMGANQFRSADRQKALQAQRDWVRAKLRKESGAAIAVDEMNQEIATYFPQIGDSPEVIEQKKIAREQATQGLIQSSGSAYAPPAERQAPIMSKANAKMPAKPKLGTVEGGYVYTGGNPSDPTSWKKK